MGEPNQKQHTVHASYLCGFATPATRRKTKRKKRVLALDLAIGEWGVKKPRETFVSRRFYDVDLSSGETDFVESKILQRLEDFAAPVILELADAAAAWVDGRGGELELTPRQREVLAFLTAMMHVRTTAARQRMTDTADAFIRELVDRTRKEPQSFREAIEAAGIEIGRDLSAQEVESARLLGMTGLEGDFDETSKVVAMVKGHGEVAQILLEIPPTLLVAGRSAGVFVTSDSPVSVDPHDLPVGEVVAATLTGEGQSIFLPLNPRVALRYDKLLGPGRCAEASAYDVGTVNAATALTNASCVISSVNDFHWRRGRERLAWRDLVGEWAGIREPLAAAHREHAVGVASGMADRITQSAEEDGFELL